MEIIQVVPRVDNKVYVYDADGTIYLYDAQKLVERYDLLKNKDFFINRCTILNNSLAWDVEGNRNDEKCIDVAPESILASPIAEEAEVFNYVDTHKQELKNRLSL